MNNHSLQNDMEREKIDEAWEKLRGKLKDDPVHPQWNRWSEANGSTTAQDSWATYDREVQTASETIGISHSPLTMKAVQRKPSLLTRWKSSKYGKWSTGAAAAVIVAAVLFTPVGNNALAAILDQFRMETITTVQRNEVEQMFNTIFPDGMTRESVNPYGSFSRTTGSIYGEFTIEEASTALGRDIVVPSRFKGSQVNVSPSETITLTMKVDEINKAMKRLGASKLLPESLNGKPVTVQLGETVSMELSTGDNRYVTLTQQPVPTIHVDASQDVREALDAVLDFPLLPEHLKSSLRSSDILSGSVPLPKVADEKTTMLKVEGFDVIVEKSAYAKRHVYYSAMWVMNGQLFQLHGNDFEDEETLKKKLSELIHQ